MQASDSAVVFADYTSLAAAIENRSDLTEHGTWMDRHQVKRRRRCECLVDITVATNKEEHLLRVFTLNADPLIWFVQVERKLLKDCSRDALIKAKHRLALDHCIELMLNNACFDTWR